MRHLLTTPSSGRLRNTLSEMQLTKICTAYLPHRPSEYHLEVEPGKEVIERVKLLKEFLLTRGFRFSAFPWRRVHARPLPRRLLPQVRPQDPPPTVQDRVQQLRRGGGQQVQAVISLGISGAARGNSKSMLLT